MKRTRLLRMLCAFAFILLVFFGLILHTGSGTLSAIGWRDIAAVCPLGALEAMLAEKTLIPRAILGALAVVAFSAESFVDGFVPFLSLNNFLAKRNMLVSRLQKKRL